MPVFEGGGGGRGESELFASRGWNLGGVFFVLGLPGWFEIFIIFFFYFPLLPFTLPYLTYMYLANLGPLFFFSLSLSLYEDGLLTRRRVFFGFLTSHL